MVTHRSTSSVPSPAPRRRSGRGALGLAVASVMLAGLALARPVDARSIPSTSTARDEAAADCLARQSRVDVDDRPAVPYLDVGPELVDGTVVDARGSVLDNTALDRAGFGIALRLRGDVVGRDLCVVGGTVRTTLDPESTPWDTWHRVTAVPVAAPGVRVVGTTFRNEGDLLAFLGGAQGWQVIGVRADGGAGLAGAYAHDDCVENDSMLSGEIVDSKFDGCWTFLSSTRASEDPIDGSANHVSVRDTLVRLQPYRNSFDVPKYGEGGHSGFFKWARTESTVMRPPALSVSDSVFRADDPARYGGNENGFLGLPPGTRCERVTLIGTATWPPDELSSWRDQCTDLHLGTIDDWNEAVAAWDAAHPPLRDLAGQARDRLAAALGW